MGGEPTRQQVKMFTVCCSVKMPNLWFMEVQRQWPEGMHLLSLQSGFYELSVSSCVWDAVWDAVFIWCNLAPKSTSLSALSWECFAGSQTIVHNNLILLRPWRDGSIFRSTSQDWGCVVGNSLSYHLFSAVCDRGDHYHLQGQGAAPLGALAFLHKICIFD